MRHAKFKENDAKFINCSFDTTVPKHIAENFIQ